MSDESAGRGDSVAGSESAEAAPGAEPVDDPRGGPAAGGAEGDARASGAGGARDVVVPIAVYKRVTAYATLTAVVAVVLGFVMLDAATLQVSLTRRFLLGVLAAAGVFPPDTLVTALFSLLGLGLIAFGAGVYVLGSRFRAEGMGTENGNAQDDDPEV